MCRNTPGQVISVSVDEMEEMIDDDVDNWHFLALIKARRIESCHFLAGTRSVLS